MNLGLHLYNYLQEKGSAELPGFGVFTLKKKSATLDEQSSKILPPTYEISFVENKNVFNADFSKYIVEKTGENLFVVQSLIKEEVTSWIETLSAEQKITIDEIGEFSLEENVIKLLDQKKYTNTPKFFGLEEISLEQIQNSENSENLPESDNQYVFNNSILWIFLFILPVGAIIYLAINYQDQIFGKKSFDEVTVKTSTHRIPEKPKVNPIVPKDSLQTSKTDSLRISK